MPYYDGQFLVPVPLQGDGVRVFSEFSTDDFILTRRFAQHPSVYRPLPLSTIDSQYKTAYLIEESEEQRDGALVYARRIYATIPSPRTERQEVVFTFPGESDIVSTTVDGVPVKRWDPHGKKKPASVYREARIDVSYSIGAPSTDLPTQILFGDQPVDFVGRVYTEDGAEFRGVTSPFIAPSVFIVSDVARRWRGNIWERTRIRVSRTGGAGGIL